MSESINRCISRPNHVTFPYETDLVSVHFCNGSKLISIQENYKMIHHSLSIKFQSTYIQALPPLWERHNYYYMNSLSYGLELIRPIRYNFGGCLSKKNMQHSVILLGPCIVLESTYKDWILVCFPKINH